MTQRDVGFHDQIEERSVEAEDEAAATSEMA